MADYFLQFSETVSGLAEPETAWLADQLRCVAVIDGVEYPADEIPDGVTTDQVAWLGPRFLRGVADYEDSPGEPAFCYEFGADEDDDVGRYLWLYSEDHADLDQVALLVQKFLRTFRPADVWTFTYATTCSKPRCGAFGGGAGIVMADNIMWHDAELIADAARRQADSSCSPAS